MSTRKVEIRSFVKITAFLRRKPTNNRMINKNGISNSHQKRVKTDRKISGPLFAGDIHLRYASHEQCLTVNVLNFCGSCMDQSDHGLVFVRHRLMPRALDTAV